MPFKVGGGRAKANLLRLLRFSIRRGKNRTGFKQADVVISAIQVVGQHVENAGDERRSHDRGFFAQWVFKLDDGERGKLLGVGVGDKTQRDGFVVSEGEQCGAQFFVLARIGGLGNGPGEGGKRFAEFVIAMQAGNFFDEINFAFYVQTPTGNAHQVIGIGVGNHDESKPAKDADDFRVAEVFAENALYLGAIELDGSEIKNARHRVNFISLELAAT